MKIRGLLILMILPLLGYTQDLKSDIKSIFFNQPIFDSINEVANGEFGVKFIRNDWALPLPGPPTIDYTYPFKKHNLFPKAFGSFQIKKLFSDTSIYFLRLQMNFKSNKEQLLTFDRILKLVSRYPSVKTTIEDFKDNDHLIGQEVKMIVNIDNKDRILTMKYMNYNKYFKTGDKYYYLFITMN